MTRSLRIGLPLSLCMAIAAWSGTQAAFSAPMQRPATAAHKTAATQPHARGQMREHGAAFVQRIEAKLGHPLRAVQKQQLRDAVHSAAKKGMAVQQKFVRDLAKATKLTPDQIQQVLRDARQTQGERGRALLAGLRQQLGRPFTARERTGIKDAVTARRTAMQRIMTTLTTDVSRITGLSADQLKSLRPQRPEGQRGQRHLRR